MGKNTKIYLDAGHGGSDPGAVGNGLHEANLTLDIVNRIKNKLNSGYTGFSLLLSRTGDTTKSLKQRTDEANKWGADYFLSVHINAGGGTGYEDYIYNGTTSSQTKSIRSTIHNEIVKKLPSVRNRGMKSKNLHVVRESKMPSMLTENLFIDNTEDAKLLKDSKVLDSIAEGHVNGLVKAFNLTKKTKSVATSPVSKPSTEPTKNPTPSKSPSKTTVKPDYKTDSIVTYLNSIGVDSSFANRTILAKKYGISRYRGTAEQNLHLLDILRSSGTSKPVTTVKPRGDLKTNSVVDYLKSIGVDSSFANRKKLASQRGISNYKGTPTQNTQLLKKLRS